MDLDAAAEDARRTLRDVGTLIVKLGSAVVTDGHGGLDNALLASVSAQIAGLRGRGVRVVVVSSGAVAAGVAELGLGRRPRDLPRLQAAAAVGQRRLMDAWAEALRPHGLHAAQLLLTRDDADNRTRFLNLRDTITAAHGLGAVPILNENDTTATEELHRFAGGGTSFGDNDMLAAVVCAALRAEALIVLSTAAGLLDAAGRIIPAVASVGEARHHLFTGTAAKTAAGKGGMAGKLDAAEIVTAAGEAMVVADGRLPDVLRRVVDGEPVGTIFLPASGRRAGRLRWVATARPCGSLHVDAGAERALRGGGASLLPVGVTRVEGDFARGDVVRIVGPAGGEIARGLARCASAEARRLAGKRAAAADPPAEYEELVHRDDLVLRPGATGGPL